jgi:hypothetical protein
MKGRKVDNVQDCDGYKTLLVFSERYFMVPFCGHEKLRPLSQYSD